ncbi:hypothetical protein SDC9_162427 [bioreactor metagenome]|uniref:Uncharacterized protein n=1 Tax=bioreactor metagenome TaxID=1076179 RepID=A0A645FL09_9ZZZZ
MLLRTLPRPLRGKVRWGNAASARLGQSPMDPIHPVPLRLPDRPPPRRERVHEADESRGHAVDHFLLRHLGGLEAPSARRRVLGIPRFLLSGRGRDSELADPRPLLQRLQPRESRNHGRGHLHARTAHQGAGNGTQERHAVGLRDHDRAEPQPFLGHGHRVQAPPGEFGPVQRHSGLLLPRSPRDRKTAGVGQRTPGIPRPDRPLLFRKLEGVLRARQRASLRR